MEVNGVDTPFTQKPHKRTKYSQDNFSKFVASFSPLSNQIPGQQYLSNRSDSQRRDETWKGTQGLRSFQTWAPGERTQRCNSWSPPLHPPPLPPQPLTPAGARLGARCHPQESSPGPPKEGRDNFCSLQRPTVSTWEATAATQRRTGAAGVDKGVNEVTASPCFCQFWSC